MSRAAGKAKGERGKGAQSTPNPAMQHEIIPGKFTEHDWNMVMGANDLENFISEIVKDTVDRSLGIIYDKYLAKQLIPFNVLEAKEAMVQIIEWNFLSHDNGESDDSIQSSSWTIDEEPTSSIIDSWGQGYIPRTAVSPRMSLASTPREIPPTIHEEDTMAEINESILDDAVIESPTENPTDSLSEKEQSNDNEIPTSSTSSPAKFRFRPYRGHIKSGKFSTLNETLYETELRMNGTKPSATNAATQKSENQVLDMPASCLSILKVQSGRPPGNKEVIYDEHGNVVSVVKIHPDRLPNHRVNVGYRVLEPEVEAERARLEALKKGQRVLPKSRKPEQKLPPGHASASEGKYIKAHVPTTQDTRLDPLPPSLVDTIELAPGVSVREGGITRSGASDLSSGNEKFAEIQLKGLKPVQVRIAGQKIHTLTANDILPPEHVAIKPPMSLRQPIPPIQSAH